MMKFGMLSVAVLLPKVEPVGLVKTALGLTEDAPAKDSLPPPRRPADTTPEPF